MQTETHGHTHKTEDARRRPQPVGQTLFVAAGRGGGGAAPVELEAAPAEVVHLPAMEAAPAKLPDLARPWPTQ